jgi:hypothetical protein
MILRSNGQIDSFRYGYRIYLEISPEDLAGKLASQHCPGSTPVTASRLPNGAFNICYRVTFENGHRVVARFAGLGRVIARNEKVQDVCSRIVTLK